MAVSQSPPKLDRPCSSWRLPPWRVGWEAPLEDYSRKTDSHMHMRAAQATPLEPPGSKANEHWRLNWSPAHSMITRPDSGKEVGRLAGDSPLGTSTQRTEKPSSFRSAQTALRPCSHTAWVRIPPRSLTSLVSLYDLINLECLSCLLNWLLTVLTEKGHNACKLLSTGLPTKCWLILAIILNLWGPAVGLLLPGSSPQCPLPSSDL